MRYLIFHNRRIDGPYEPDDLARLPGFSSETLVCPEDCKGNRQADWQRAAAFAALSALVSTRSEETLEANSTWGTPFAALMREAAAQSSAALGKTRDQIVSLEEAVSRLEEGLRLKDEQAAGLRADLEKGASEESAARESLRERIGGLEGAFARLEKGLGDALEEKDGFRGRLESAAEGQARALEALGLEVASLKNEVQAGSQAACDQLAARQALHEKVARLEEAQSGLEKGLAEISALRAAPAKAPAGEPGLEAAVESQARAIEDMTRELEALKAGLDNRVGSLDGALAKLEAGLLSELPVLRRKVEQAEAEAKDAESTAERLALAVEELKAAKTELAPETPAPAQDAAALESLKEKVASIEGAVSRLEEGLGLAGGELASLREGLEKAAANRKAPDPAPHDAALGGLRDKLAALGASVSRLDEGLRLKAGEISLLRAGMDQAAAAGKGAEAAADRLARAVEDLKAAQPAAPAPALPLTLKVELSPRSGMIKPPEPALAPPAASQSAVKIPPAAPPPAAPASDKTMILPPSQAGALAAAAEPEIPREVNKERIRQVAVLYAKDQAENKDALIKRLRSLSQEMSKSKSIYLRQVLVEEVSPGADLKALVKKIHDSGAAAVLGVLAGLPEPLLLTLSRSVKQAGVLFENVAPEDVQKKSRAVDVLADLMLLPPHD